MKRSRVSVVLVMVSSLHCGSGGSGSAGGGAGGGGAGGGAGGGTAATCTATALTVSGSLETSEVNVPFTTVESTVAHKIDVDVQEDGCVVAASFDFKASAAGCKLHVEFSGQPGFAGLASVTFSADSFCPGFPDAREGNYTLSKDGYGLGWFSGPTRVSQRTAVDACLPGVTISFPNRPLVLQRADGATLTVNLKGLSLSGNLSSKGNPALICPVTNVCQDFFHDDGSAWCSSGSNCIAGYHDGGDYNCVPLGACSSGYRANTAGTCAFWPISNEPAQQLLAVRGISPNDVWAAGEQGTMFHWNGTAWAAVSSGGTGSINAIWASASNDVWAVGSAGRIIHWTGAAWAGVTSGTTKGLRGIWGFAANDVWAVGEDGTALHWTGTAWVSMPTGTLGPLIGIWGSGANDIWATAGYGAILHWNGASWKAVSFPNPNHSAYSVWGSSANDVWAVGSTTVVHWDGSSWTVPSIPGVPLPTAVWSSGPNNVWIAGDKVLHWNGTVWTSQKSNTQVNALWGTGPNDIWAVGNQILHGP